MPIRAMAMSGKQFGQMIKGELRPAGKCDIDRLIEEMRIRYPHANLDADDLGVRATAKAYHCMTCGSITRDLTNFKKTRHGWVPKKRKDNVSQQICFGCDPTGVQIAIIVYQQAVAAEVQMG